MTTVRTAAVRVGGGEILPVRREAQQPLAEGSTHGVCSGLIAADSPAAGTSRTPAIADDRWTHHVDHRPGTYAQVGSEPEPAAR